VYEKLAGPRVEYAIEQREVLQVVATGLDREQAIEMSSHRCWRLDPLVVFVTQNGVGRINL
jgi:hypothetical protein